MCRLDEWLHHLFVTWPSSACCVSEVMKFALAEASPTKMQVSPLAVAQRGRGTRQRGGGEARGEKGGWMEEGEEEEEAAAAGSRGGVSRVRSWPFSRPIHLRSVKHKANAVSSTQRQWKHQAQAVSHILRPETDGATKEMARR